MKLPSNLLGAMILTAALGTLSTGCSHPGTAPNEAAVILPAPPPAAKTDTLISNQPGPDTATMIVPGQHPQIENPHHAGGWDCPACGKG